MSDPKFQWRWLYVLIVRPFFKTLIAVMFGAMLALYLYKIPYEGKLIERDALIGVGLLIPLVSFMFELLEHIWNKQKKERESGQEPA